MRFNPLQSYVLFGALLLLAIAYRAALRQRERSPHPDARPC